MSPPSNGLVLNRYPWRATKQATHSFKSVLKKKILIGFRVALLVKFFERFLCRFDAPPQNPPSNPNDFAQQGAGGDVAGLNRTPLVKLLELWQACHTTRQPPPDYLYIDLFRSIHTELSSDNHNTHKCSVLFT